MSENKEITQIEEKNKKFIFDAFDSFCDKQNEWIEIIKKNLECLEYNDTNIDNSSIIANNKLIEFANRFKDSGISMYVDYDSESNSINSSFVGEALINDILEQLNTSTEMLVEISRHTATISKEKVENYKLYQEKNSNTFKKLIYKIKVLLKKEKNPTLYLNDAEKSKFDTLVTDYRNFNDKLWNSKLEDRIIPAVSKAITEPVTINDKTVNHRYSVQEIPNLFGKYIIPTFEKLGLKDLLPKLKDEVFDVYLKEERKNKTLVDIIDKDKFKAWYIRCHQKTNSEEEILQADLKRNEDKNQNDIIKENNDEIVK